MDSENRLDDTLAKQIEKNCLRLGEQHKDEMYSHFYQKWKQDRQMQHNSMINSLWVTTAQMTPKPKI